MADVNLNSIGNYGVTYIRIDYGKAAYIEYDLATDKGWNVIDNRRRYPRCAGEGLTSNEAVRAAIAMPTKPEGWTVK